MRRHLATILAVGFLAACTAPTAEPEVALPPAATASPTTAAPTPTPADAPSPEPTATPEPSASPSPSPSPSPKPTFAYDVVAAQEKLAALRYYGGPVDGEFGAQMRAAVVAFQKVNGLTADGVVGPITLAALDAPVAPTLAATAPADRMEIDLTKQVLYFVQGGELVRIMPISSGSGAKYETSRGSIARSLTPVGWYTVTRKITGLREADLGSLYDPMYFYRGWAIHGSNSVPAYPASHGCVRVTRSDALWLFDRVPRGFHVYVYGGTHTFPAGSSAPGTDTPAGDTGSPPDAEPTPSPTPTTTPAPSPTPSPSSTPTPTPSPSAPPSPSASPSPSPSASPSPSPSASPTPQPSPTATGTATP